MFSADTERFLELAASRPEELWRAEFAQAQKSVNGLYGRLGFILLFTLLRRLTHPDGGLYGLELFLMFSWLSLSTASEVVGVLPWTRIRPSMHWMIILLLAPLGPLSVLYWLFFCNQVSRALVNYDMAREVLAQRAADAQWEAIYAETLEASEERRYE